MTLNRSACEENNKVHIISIGEVLWDLLGQDEFLGGAPFNFSVAMQRLGHHVLLLSGVGSDQRGSRALRQMKHLGLPTQFVQTVTELPTGTAIVKIDSQNNPRYTIGRPAAFDCLQADEHLLSRLVNTNPDWIYFGTLAQMFLRTEEALMQLTRMARNVKCFYDMNLRTGHWEMPLVQRLSKIATVLKLNETEAKLLFDLTFGPRKFTLEEFCRYWSETHGVETICVTLGSNGCAIYADGSLQAFNGFRANVVDTIGAGDAFAAALLHGLHLHWPLSRAAQFANALGALVVSRAGATPDWSVDDCWDLIGGAEECAPNNKGSNATR